MICSLFYCGKQIIKQKHWLSLGPVCLMLILLLVACGTSVRQVPAQASVTIDPHFQTQLSPLPTVPPYRCGAWASNNVPSAYGTITIYAKLTQDVTGVPGIPAKAIVHFRGGDQKLAQQPTTDSNGYVTFTLPLAGQQPVMVPATVDVIFTPANTHAPVQCSAFFTPQ